MSERIHKALDGEIPIESLSDGERRVLESMVAALDEAVRSVKAVPAPDLTARILSALPEAPERLRRPAPAARLTEALLWLWKPTQVSIALRPVYAAVAVILLVLGLGVLERGAVNPGEMAASPSGTPSIVYVQFRLDAPGAASVELSGSFTNWTSGVPLIETAPGTWSAIVALEPGVHDYAFVVDGRSWVVDPAAPAVDDGFGGRNSRLFLTRPGGDV